MASSTPAVILRQWACLQDEGVAEQALSGGPLVGVLLHACSHKAAKVWADRALCWQRHRLLHHLNKKDNNPILSLLLTLNDEY